MLPFEKVVFIILLAVYLKGRVAKGKKRSQHIAADE